MKTQPNKIFALAPLLLAPGLAAAGLPEGMQYDQWSAAPNAGGGSRIVTGATDICAQAGVTCRALAEDDGFLQQEITTPNHAFIRLIFTEAGTTGAATDLGFTSESFIGFAMAPPSTPPYGMFNDPQGIAAKQIIRETATNPATGLPDTFVTSAELQKGDFKEFGALSDLDKFNIKLSQVIDQGGQIGTSFDFTNYTQAMTSFPSGQAPASAPDTDTVMGYTMDINQTLPETSSGAGDKMVFDFKKRSGEAGWRSFFGNTPLTTAATATVGGTPISWQNADTISATWIAQGDVVDGTSGASFGFSAVQTYAGPTAGATQQASTFLLDIPPPVTAAGDPFGWESTNFGPAPTFP